MRSWNIPLYRQGSSLWNVRILISAQQPDTCLLYTSHTYSGNPLGCAAALAVLKILREEQILAQAKKRAFYLHQCLKEALGDHPHVGEIRHIGLINALELVKDKGTKRGFPAELRLGYEIYKKALGLGLLLRPLGNVLYFNPPLIINEREIDLAVKRCAQALKSVLS